MKHDPPKTGRGEQIPVDLRLAHTYIPAIVCFTKAAALALGVANTNAIRHLPTLLVAAVPLYLDRVTRSETIFDSNSLLCALFAAYLVDSARSEHVGDLALHTTTPAAWALGTSWALSLLSVAVCLDVDVLTHSEGPAVGRSWVILLQAVLLVVSMQGSPSENRAEYAGVLVRSFSFVSMCITWTYSIGIRSMIDLLNSTTRLPTSSILMPKSLHRRGTQSVIVQSFTPCMMRFAAVLFLDGWAQIACIVGGSAATLYRASLQGYMARNGYGASKDHADTHSKSGHDRDSPSDESYHPEYKTQTLSDPFPPQWATAPLFLQQDTDFMGSSRAAIRRAPIGLPDAGDASAEPTRASKAATDIQPEQSTKHQPTRRRDIEAGDAQPPSSEDDEAYQMLQQAKRAMESANKSRIS